MRRPTKAGWYWVLIPGEGVEVVYFHVFDSDADNRYPVCAYRTASDEPYRVPKSDYRWGFSIKGWRWLGQVRPPRKRRPESR